MVFNKMKIIILWTFLFPTTIGTMTVYAEGEGTVPDVSYLTRHVETPGFFDLIPHGHKVSKYLVGKELMIISHGMEIIRCQFVDDTTVKWWHPPRPDIRMQNPYVVFEIREDIYMVTFVENESFAPPMDPNIDLNTWSPRWYSHDTSTTFVLDLKNKIMTDAFMQPDGKGNLQYNVVQADVELRPIKE